jgi:hypothetical protein
LFAVATAIDIEAWPFVALAAVASLSFAAAAWLRSGAATLLALVAAAMLAFAALDVREVVHQLDIDTRRLAVLARAIATLRAAAAAAAGTLASRARRPDTAPPRTAGTMYAADRGIGQPAPPHGDKLPGTA